MSVKFIGGDASSLVNAGAGADIISITSRVTGTLFLINAHATEQGLCDTINSFAGTNNIAAVPGSNEALVSNSAAVDPAATSDLSVRDTSPFNVAN